MRFKLVAGGFLIGGAMTAVFAYLSHEPGRHWFDGILWIGYLSGSFASGNVHSPNAFVAWLTIYLGMSALACGVAVLVEFLRTRSSRAARD